MCGRQRRQAGSFGRSGRTVSGGGCSSAIEDDHIDWCERVCSSRGGAASLPPPPLGSSHGPKTRNHTSRNILATVRGKCIDLEPTGAFCRDAHSSTHVSAAVTLIVAIDGTQTGPAAPRILRQPAWPGTENAEILCLSFGEACVKPTHRSRLGGGERGCSSSAQRCFQIVSNAHSPQACPPGLLSVASEPRSVGINPLQEAMSILQPPYDIASMCIIHSMPPYTHCTGHFSS